MRMRDREFSLPLPDSISKLLKEDKSKLNTEEISSGLRALWEILNKNEYVLSAREISSTLNTLSKLQARVQEQELDKKCFKEAADQLMALIHERIYTFTPHDISETINSILNLNYALAEDPHTISSALNALWLFRNQVQQKDERPFQLAVSKLISCTKAKVYDFNKDDSLIIIELILNFSDQLQGHAIASALEILSELKDRIQYGDRSFFRLAISKLVKRIPDQTSSFTADDIASIVNSISNLSDQLHSRAIPSGLIALRQLKNRSNEVYVNQSLIIAAASKLTAHVPDQINYFTEQDISDIVHSIKGINFGSAWGKDAHAALSALNALSKLKNFVQESDSWCFRSSTRTLVHHIFNEINNLNTDDDSSTIIMSISDLSDKLDGYTASFALAILAKLKNRTQEKNENRESLQRTASRLFERISSIMMSGRFSGALDFHLPQISIALSALLELKDFKGVNKESLQKLVYQLMKHVSTVKQVCREPVTNKTPLGLYPTIARDTMPLLVTLSEWKDFIPEEYRTLYQAAVCELLADLPHEIIEVSSNLEASKILSTFKALLRFENLYQEKLFKETTYALILTISHSADNISILDIQDAFQILLKTEEILCPEEIGHCEPYKEAITKAKERLRTREESFNTRKMGKRAAVASNPPQEKIEKEKMHESISSDSSLSTHIPFFKKNMLTSLAPHVKSAEKKHIKLLDTSNERSYTTSNEGGTRSFVAHNNVNDTFPQIFSFIKMLLANIPYFHSVVKRMNALEQMSMNAPSEPSRIDIALKNLEAGNKTYGLTNEPAATQHNTTNATASLALEAKAKQSNMIGTNRMAKLSKPPVSIFSPSVNNPAIKLEHQIIKINNTH